VDPQPPPWRVLDAPAPHADDTSANDAAGATESPAGRAAHLGLTPSILGALALAIVLGVVAVVVAASSLTGTTIEAAGGPSGTTSAASPGAYGLLVVDVAGAVVRPGVYRLAPGSRVADAVAAAGGFAPRVDAARVAAELNLAALVRDGDRIVVPTRDAVGVTGGPGGPPATAGPIDLNHATAEQLDTLPGIGPVTAAKIVASREAQPFRSVDELRSRGLIGEKTYDKLKSLVTVS
jgi:competence protein ComEA